MGVYLKNTKSILIWLICLTYIGMFLSIRISNIPLIALLLFCLVTSRPKEIINTLKESLPAKILMGMYFLTIIGLLYSTNLKAGFFILEKKIAFLLVPLFVLPHVRKFHIADYNLLFKWIGFITLASSAILLCIATFRKFVLHYPKAFFFESFRAFEGFTPIHYVYYALYFACGSLILLDCLYDSLIKKRHGFLILFTIFIYSLSIIILVASKTGILIFAIASAIFLFHKLGSKKVFTASVILILLAVSVLLYFNDTTRSRFTGLDQDISVVTKDDLSEELTITGLNMRLLFWKIQLQHLWHEHLILSGVGPGDAQDYINSLYNLPQYKLYGYIGWDSHNQWVYTLIQLGIPGLLLYALLYIKYLKEAFSRTDLKLICFLIITLGFSLSESILELNKGIIFFTLFFILLSAPYTKNKLLDGRTDRDQRLT